MKRELIHGLLALGVMALLLFGGAALIVNVAMAQESAAIAEANKTANLGRLDHDAKTGVYRAWITLSPDHSMIAKFKTAPTETDIKAVRDKALAQELEAKAAADAAAAKAAQSETWKSEGKCPCCGQALPKVEDK